MRDPDEGNPGRQLCPVTEGYRHDLMELCVRGPNNSLSTNKEAHMYTLVRVPAHGPKKNNGDGLSKTHCSLLLSLAHTHANKNTSTQNPPKKQKPFPKKFWREL